MTSVLLNIIMGLLTEGQPLSWDETKALADHVRKHGVQQFIHLYRKLETRKGDVLKWGDEVEYVLVKMDDQNKTAKLLLKAGEYLGKLQVPELRGDKDLPSLWRPEYASYMVEGTPGGPYGGAISEFREVQANMEKRRKEIEAFCGPNEKIFTITAYPRMGCDDFTEPSERPDIHNSVTKSLFWPDDAIFGGHPRFKVHNLSGLDRKRFQFKMYKIILEFSELIKEYQIEKRRKSSNEHSRFHGSKY